MATGPARIAVVTGANKGIGFEVVRELVKHKDLVVIMGVRDVALGRAAADSLEGMLRIP
jgi:NAD(P)-dependent dehydrogenase (short-subunit alcohol dehydrogenase family)